MIEASPDMHMESEKEWYFGNAEKERLGPYSYEEVSIILKQWKARCSQVYYEGFPVAYANTIRLSLLQLRMLICGLHSSEK